MKPYPVYIILECHDAQALADVVNSRMAAGYVPYGPVGYNHCCKHSQDVEDSHYYYQAMTLPEGERPKNWRGE